MTDPDPRPPTSEGSAPAIPDKLYFRIGEVAALCRVPDYVLRFWQTEFPQLRPGKSGTGQRLYRRRDVEMALRIKHLLHKEGYTIAGAKGVLVAKQAVPPPAPVGPPASAARSGERAQSQLAHVRAELRELLRLLDRPPATGDLASPTLTLLPHKPPPD